MNASKYSGDRSRIACNVRLMTCEEFSGPAMAGTCARAWRKRCSARRRAHVPLNALTAFLGDAGGAAEEGGGALGASFWCTALLRGAEGWGEVRTRRASESIDEFRQPGQHVAAERRVRNQPTVARRGADGSLMLKFLRLFDKAGAAGECR